MKKPMSFLAMTTSMSLLLLSSLCASSTINDSFFDAPEEVTFPQNFRILNHPPADLSTCNVLGLDQLKVSGSGQFSEKGFSELVKALPLESEQLIICDLRAEYHGLVNGLPMCWIDELDSNDPFNQTAEEIELDEYRRLELALQTGYVWIDQGPEQTEQVGLAVSQVTTERAFVEGMSHIYVRFAVETGRMPNDQLVDQFVQFINCLSPDQWVHFHCQVGQHRTTLFLLLMDMIKNSHQVSLEDILARHQLINGLDLKGPHSKGISSGWDEQEEFDFLSKFYVYCQQVPDFRISWSEWIQQQSLALDEELKTEFQPVMQTQENIKNVSLKGFDKVSDVYGNMSFSPASVISTNKDLFHTQLILDAVSDISEVLSNKSFKHGHGDKAGGSVRVDYKRSFGGDKKGDWEVTGTARAEDGKGNYVEGKVTKKSDGTGEVGVGAGHESK